MKSCSFTNFGIILLIWLFCLITPAGFLDSDTMPFRICDFLFCPCNRFKTTGCVDEECGRGCGGIFGGGNRVGGTWGNLPAGVLDGHGGGKPGIGNAKPGRGGGGHMAGRSGGLYLNDLGPYIDEGPGGGGTSGIPGGGNIGRKPAGGPPKPKCGNEKGPSFVKPRRGGTRPGGPIVYGWVGCGNQSLGRALTLPVLLFSRGIFCNAFI